MAFTKTTELPTAPLRNTDTFTSDMEAFLLALVNFVPEINTLADEMYTSANLLAVTATSYSSRSVAEGLTGFVIEPGRGFMVGHMVQITSRADVNLWMRGVVTEILDDEFGNPLLRANITQTNGEGTANDWDIISIIVPDTIQNSDGSNQSTAAEIRGHLDDTGHPHGMPQDYITGLTLSQGLDYAHDVHLSPGICRSMDDSADLELTTEITKQLDTSWTPGNNAGGLSSSLTVAAYTTYHVFVFLKGGAVDAGFDTDPDAPNLIADHGVTAYRRVGSIITDGSAVIVPFTQQDDRFLITPVVDFQGTAPSTYADLTLSVPAGISVLPLLTIQIRCASGLVSEARVRHPSSNVYARFGRLAIGTNAVIAMSHVAPPTTPAAALEWQVIDSAPGDTLVYTSGWIDKRNRGNVSVLPPDEPF